MFAAPGNFWKEIMKFSSFVPGALQGPAGTAEGKQALGNPGGDASSWACRGVTLRAGIFKVTFVLERIS